MQIFWGRLMLFAVLVELLSSVSFIISLSALTPENIEGIRSFALTHRYWLGPSLGLFFTFIASYINGKLMFKYQVRNGVALGILIVLIDLLCLIFGLVMFSWVFILSNVLKILASIAGGWCSKKSDPRLG